MPRRPPLPPRPARRPLPIEEEDHGDEMLGRVLFAAGCIALLTALYLALARLFPSLLQ